MGGGGFRCSSRTWLRTFPHAPTPWWSGSGSGGVLCTHQACFIAFAASFFVPASLPVSPTLAVMLQLPLRDHLMRLGAAMHGALRHHHCRNCLRAASADRQPPRLSPGHLRYLHYPQLLFVVPIGKPLKGSNSLRRLRRRRRRYPRRFPASLSPPCLTPPSLTAEKSIIETVGVHYWDAAQATIMAVLGRPNIIYDKDTTAPRPATERVMIMSAARFPLPPHPPSII